MVDLTAMEIIKILGAVTGVITGITALVKAIKSDDNVKKANSEIDAINAARKVTALARDEESRLLKTEVEVLKEQVKTHDNCLKDGNERFASIEGEIKDTNGLLREILGALKIKFNLPINGNGNL